MDCVMSHHHDCRTLRENIIRRQQQQGGNTHIDSSKTASTSSLSRTASEMSQSSAASSQAQEKMPISHFPPPLRKHGSETHIPTITSGSSSPRLFDTTSSISSALSSPPMLRSKSFDFMFPWTSSQSNNTAMSNTHRSNDPARGFLSFNPNWRYDREQRRVIIGREPDRD